MARKETDRHAPEEVNAYLAALPENQQRALEGVRGIVRELAPAATERVSYGIPIFRLGKDLVGLSAAKNHCALHTMSPSLMERLADELADVKTSGATIRFTLEEPLPREVIELVVRVRMEEVR